ncbi:MAG: hypothetical protein RI575_04045 [Balneolaceae bacterium]|nr:hypothetical protein [Balneolaceae bacterium]
MNNVISPDLNQLNPYDLFYLTDVASENIGQRLEGWEIGVELDLRYNVSHHYRRNKLLSTEESNISSSELELQPNMYIRWYKNFTLRHQLGFESAYRYYYDLKNSDFNEHSLTSELSWLYTITDRFITNTIFLYRYNKNDYIPSSYYHLGRLGVNLNYFIENKLSFFVNARYSTQKIVETNESLLSRNFNFSAGLRYYFKRELF